MKIEKLKRENKQWIDEGAELLVACFEHAWDTKEEALEDMEKFVQEERGGSRSSRTILSVKGNRDKAYCSFRRSSL